MEQKARLWGNDLRGPVQIGHMNAMPIGWPHKANGEVLKAAPRQFDRRRRCGWSPGQGRFRGSGRRGIADLSPPVYLSPWNWRSVLPAWIEPPF